MRLKRLLDGLEYKAESDILKVQIRSIATNSKSVKKRDLFVALEGTQIDGHKFINEAIRKGACACVVSKHKEKRFHDRRIISVNDTKEALSRIAGNWYGIPARRLKVFGITGTNGKTTTALLTQSIFNEADIPCGVIGTIEYRIGSRSIKAQHTTPDPVRLNALLDTMRKKRLKAVVMEVSSHALDQKRVYDIQFDVAVFTNITREHLDYHRNMRSYLESKKKIFSNIKKRGCAIINADCVKTKRIFHTLSCKKILYGVSRNTDIKARLKRVDLDGSCFDVFIFKKYAFSINTKLVGIHNVSNVLASIAIAVSQGVKHSAIKRGIEKINHIKGRLESVKNSKGFKLFIDYAHTHDALKNVLQFLKRIKRQNIITVFGCGGDRDRTKRPLMGCVAQKFSDFVIITNDNPRTENPKSIAEDIKKGMDKKRKNYIIKFDRKKAIENALEKAKKDDIVLIAGKGHEVEQVLGNKKIAFNDKKVAERLLKRIKTKDAIKGSFKKSR